MNLTYLVVLLLQSGILVFNLALNGTQLLFLLKAFFSHRDYQDSLEARELDSLFESIHYKPITVICPVHDEGPGVIASVNTLLALRYPEIQVVVVNDGSTDDTLAKLIEAFSLVRSLRVVRMAIPTRTIRCVYESPLITNLVVVDKEGGGKSDALNCGLNVAIFPLVCCIDGDSLLENDALLRMVKPFLDDGDTVACGGVIRPLNGCRVTPGGIRGIFLPAAWVARFQVLEYLRAFLFGRVGMANFDLMFILSGAFGLFRKSVLLEVGGFATDTVGEDLEMVVRLHSIHRRHKRPYQIRMVPDPICWTEVPEDTRILARQRNRWQRGLLDTLWRHRRAMFNPKYGRFGLISMPYFLIFEGLAPILEAFGYLAFLWFFITDLMDSQFVILFIWVSLCMGVLNSIVAVLLEVNSGHRYPGMRTLGLLLVTAILENFGYRQLTVWWRIRGTFDFLRGVKTWGHMTRKGINPKLEPAGQG